MVCAVAYVKIFNFETHLLFLNCIYTFKFFLHKSREDFISNLLRNTEFISFHNFGRDWKLFMSLKLVLCTRLHFAITWSRIAHCAVILQRVKLFVAHFRILIWPFFIL